MGRLGAWSTQYSPVNIWTKILAADRAIGCPFDSGAAFGRDAALAPQRNCRLRNTKRNSRFGDAAVMLD